MRLVEFFHIEGQDTITLGSACSSCSSGCEPITHSISETIKDFETSYPNVANLKKLTLKEETLDTVANRLQEVYTNSGEQLIITASNIKFILGKLAPVIAIDGRLVANNYVPDANELKLALDTDNGIHSTICQ